MPLAEFVLIFATSELTELGECCWLGVVGNVFANSFGVENRITNLNAILPVVRLRLCKSEKLHESNGD